MVAFPEYAAQDWLSSCCPSNADIISVHQALFHLCILHVCIVHHAFFIIASCVMHQCRSRGRTASIQASVAIGADGAAFTICDLLCTRPRLLLLLPTQMLALQPQPCMCHPASHRHFQLMKIRPHKRYLDMDRPALKSAVPSLGSHSWLTSRSRPP